VPIVTVRPSSGQFNYFQEIERLFSMTCGGAAPQPAFRLLYYRQERTMVSEKQLEANRRNAQKSTGPKTAEGKSNSSRNNLRHGLTGQISLLPTEDREAHDAFCNELIDSFNPQTPMEIQLAQSVAEDNWRLNRARAIENNMFALAHGHERREARIALADAETFQTQANAFNLLSLYEQRINRNLQRNMKLLRELQAERKAQHKQAMEEAKLLAQVNLMNGLTHEPNFGRTGASPSCDLNVNGFVFSAAEINQAIDRDNRLKAAKLAAMPLQSPIARAA
jgi:hypothetical protein